MNFEGANMEEARLMLSDFENANLLFTNMSEVDFTYANFNGAQFSNRDAGTTEERKLALLELEITDNTGEEQQLPSVIADLIEQFDPARPLIRNVNFSFADLHNAELQGARFVDCQFHHALTGGWVLVAQREPNRER